MYIGVSEYILFNNKAYVHGLQRQDSRALDEKWPPEPVFPGFKILAM